MDETLSVYIIGIKGSSYYTHAQFFFRYMGSVQSGIKEKLFERDMRRGREELVFTFAAFLFVLSRYVKIDTKMAAQATREEEVMHDD